MSAKGGRGVYFFGERRKGILWGLIGIILISLHVLLLSLSSHFSHGENPLSQSIFFLVALLILSGGVYLLVCFLLPCPREEDHSLPLFFWILAVGLILRFLMFFSTPILENDYYRYLWDGAVLSHGWNPYRYAPFEAMSPSFSHTTGVRTSVPMPQGIDFLMPLPNPGPVSPTLQRLARDSYPVAQRINHPQLRTIYPPVAQAAFALSYEIAPWSLGAWRFLLFLFDILTLLLLLFLLKTLFLPLPWIALYWWNPLLIKETFNSAHMDIMVLPFVLGALILFLWHRQGWAMGLLALAVGTKLWPLVLLPFLLRPLLGNPKKILLCLALFSLLILALFYPVYTAGLGGTHSGLATYIRHWEMNDAFFMGFLWGGQWVLKAVHAYSPLLAQQVVRGAIFLLLTLWILWLAGNKPIQSGQDLCKRCLGATAALFLLSPTQFPWYFVALLPLLTLYPYRSLLLLTPLLPLYYLRFYFLARHEVALFDNGIVWLEYLPVLGFLLWETFHPWKMDGRRLLCGKDVT